MIKKNNKKVIAIYKGGNPILKVYKGGLMVFPDAIVNVNNIAGSFRSVLSEADMWYKTGPDFDNLTKTYIESDDLTFDINVELTEPIFSFEGNDYLRHITNMSLKGLPTTRNMFMGCDFLLSCDLLNLDTSNVTSMNSMFALCKRLTSLDISNFNTSKVTDMNSMFYDCNNLESLDVSNFDTSNVTDMGYMFLRCYLLPSLDVSNFDTSKVTDMITMFCGCKALTSLDLSNFDTSNVITMEGMFADCNALTSLDLSSFDTSNVENMSEMFRGLYVMPSLDLSSFDTSNVTDMLYMFLNCKALTSLDLSNFNTSNVTDMANMFKYCNNLESLDLSNFDTSNVTSMDGMFYGCNKLNTIRCTTAFRDWCWENAETINLPSQMKKNGAGVWDLVDAPKLQGVFAPKIATFSLNDDTTNDGYQLRFNEENFDIPVDEELAFDYRWNAYENGHLYKMDYMGALAESGTSYITTIDQWFDTSTVTDISFMLWKSPYIQHVDFSTFKTDSLVSMNALFGYCENLETVIFPETFDTSKVKYFADMFWNCPSITELDLSMFDTTAVETAGYLFEGCTSLETLYLDNFDFSQITSNNLMQHMFRNCNNLNHIRCLTAFRDWCWEKQDIINLPEQLREGGSGTWELTDAAFEPNFVKAEGEWTQNVYVFTSNVIGHNTTTGEKVYFKNLGGQTITINWDTESEKNFDRLKMYALDTETEIVVDSKTSGSNNGSYGRVGTIDYTFPDNDEHFIYMTYSKDGSGSQGRDNAIVTFPIDLFGETSIVVVPDEYYIEYVIEDGVYIVKYYKLELLVDGQPLDPPQYIKGEEYSREEIDAAILSPDDTITLTVGLNTTTYQEVVPTIDENTVYRVKFTNPTNIIFNVPMKIANSSNLKGSDLESINGLTYVDTSNVTNMDSMFNSCKVLTSLNVSNFDTSNVTSMDKMFYYCNKLESLDVSNFDTSNVTSMNSMFSGCNKLESLDVSNFDTSNVTNMYGMFVDCKALTSLDVSNFDTSNVTNMGAMFNYCNNLESLDLSNFDTSNVTNMFYMFIGCNKLESLDVSNFDTSNVTNMGAMFNSCTKLESLDVSNFDTSNVTNMDSMFGYCKALTSLDVSNFDTSNVTNMDSMFNSCTKLESLDLSNFDTSNVTSMDKMFYYCTALNHIKCTQAFKDWCIANQDTINLPTAMREGGTGTWEIIEEEGNLVGEFTDTVPENGHSCYLNGATYSIPVKADNSFNTQYDENLTSAGSCWNKSYTNSSLISLDKFPSTAAVTDMSNFFYNQSELTSVEALRDMDMSKVTDLSMFFAHCNNLVDVSPIENWNLTFHNNMNFTAMFYGCSKIKKIDLSNWDIMNGDAMNSFISGNYISSLFEGCSELEEINFGNYFINYACLMNNNDWENQYSPQYHMFYGCTKLKKITCNADVKSLLENGQYDMMGNPNSYLSNTPIGQGQGEWVLI